MEMNRTGRGYEGKGQCGCDVGDGGEEISRSRCGEVGR